MKNDFDRIQIKIDRGICDTQGKIFEKACLDGCDLKLFTNSYMNSVFCKKGMDYKASRYSFVDADTCLDIIYPEIGRCKGKHSNPDMGYWIGYTYRQLSYEAGISSANLIKKVPFDLLIRNYAAHHCLDENISGEMLCDYYKLGRLPEYIAYDRYLEKVENL